MSSMKKFGLISFIIVIGLVAIISLSLNILTVSYPQTAINFLQDIVPTPTVSPLNVTGIGVIGDSLSDEYRADDNRGLTYASTTLNYLEVLAKYRNLNFGEWGVYEEPRRQGYAYNFARTGQDVSMAIGAGQASGLADFIKQGKVNTVIIFLGVNDFSPLANDGYAAIYNNNMTDEQVAQKVNRLDADMKTIVEVLQNAGNVHILLVTIPDWGQNNLVQLAFPIPDQRQRVSNAIDQTNSGFEELAKEKGIAVADYNDFVAILDKRETNDSLLVGNIKLNKYFPGDDPRDVFLDDGVHPGTIYNGLFANFIIANLNSKLGTNIRPFTDKEILSIAGV